MNKAVRGQFECSIDDKGRVLLPLKLKEQLDLSEDLILTRGVDECLWLLLPDAWENIQKTLGANTSRFDRKGMMIQRRVVGPAEELQVDASGRMKIAGHLRKVSRLNKECLFIGMGDFIEIWSPEAYQEYEVAHSGDLSGAWEELGQG